MADADARVKGFFFHCFVSMSAYHKQRLEEEKKASLERRRNRLRAMLQEEQERLEAELREVVPDRSTLASQLVQKTEELRAVREERRKKVGCVLLLIVLFNEALLSVCNIHGFSLYP